RFLEKVCGFCRKPPPVPQPRHNQNRIGRWRSQRLLLRLHAMLLQTLPRLLENALPRAKQSPDNRGSREFAGNVAALRSTLSRPCPALSTDREEARQDEGRDSAGPD